MKIGVIDLFCGAGGLSLGFKNKGFDVIAGYDIDNSCRYPYENNINAPFYNIDISNLNGDELIEKFKGYDINVLVGCAPCQPFSSHAFKNKESNKNQWKLIYEYLRIIEQTKPHIISMENVPNLLNYKKDNIILKFKDRLVGLGYKVYDDVLYCPDYGIPQKRKRYVLLASLLGNIGIIKPTHSQDKYISTNQVISNLKAIENGGTDPDDPLHTVSKLNEINLKRIIASIPGGTWRDWPDELKLDCHRKPSGKSYMSVYGRIDGNQPSPTITTQFFIYGTGRFGHPTQNRGLSLREAALLQTFPPSFEFNPKGEMPAITKVARLIGNAVPVKLAEVIATSILNHIEKNGKKANRRKKKSD